MIAAPHLRLKYRHGFAKMNPLSSHYDNWKSYSGECKYKSQASIQSMLPIKVNQDAALIVAEIAF